MKELSKSIQRRLTLPNFANRYFVGDGIDVGGKTDPLALYVHLFSGIRQVRTWDLEDGDGQFLESIPDGSLDFVHSSHCLEHLHDPSEGLRNWIRVLKPGGHLIVTVPDEDLYEQGVFPSQFNRDHKWTFTVAKPRSWSPRSINLLDLLQPFTDRISLLKIELLDATYRYSLPRYDQTLTPVGECSIEFVARRLTDEEVTRMGRLPGHAEVDEETRLHLNQYRDDRDALRKASRDRRPFENRDDI